MPSSKSIQVERAKPKLVDVEIRQSTLIRAPPGKVYDAITTGKGLDGWFTNGATVDARSGGTITFRWKDWGPDRFTGEDGGPVLKANRPEIFVFQWHPDGPSYATTVEIEFKQADEGTVVRLRESGYHDTPSGRKALLSCASGWGEALTLLKFHVEHGVRY